MEACVETFSEGVIRFRVRRRLEPSRSLSAGSLVRGGLNVAGWLFLGLFLGIWARNDSRSFEDTVPVPLHIGAALAALAPLLGLWGLQGVKEETILVTQGVGVQLSTTFYSGHSKTRFLDMHRIGAVVLNEGITMHRVIVYLAFIVAGQDRMVVAFEHLRPPLTTLVPIYRSLHAAVTGDPDPDGGKIKF